LPVTARLLNNDLKITYIFVFSAFDRAKNNSRAKNNLPLMAGIFMANGKIGCTV
jgi:hypothetical protein